MKRMLSFIMIFAILAGIPSVMTFTVSARTVSDIVQVPLSYFDYDNDWRSASGNFASMPNVIQGSIDITKCEAATRVWGGNQSDPISAAKDEDDSYLKYKTLPNVTAGDAFFELVNYRIAPVDRVQLEAGDNNIIVVSMDIATSNVMSTSRKVFISSETNANRTSTSSNKWQNNVADINNADGKMGSIQMQSNTWYNVVFELGGATATGYKYYVDGVLAGSGNLTEGYLGLLRTGITAVANTVDDMYFDNYSLKVGEPYTIQRFYSDKAAKELNFKHIKNENTASAAVTSDLDLIEALPDDEDGTTISWLSHNHDFISNDGIVTRGLSDETVKITATIENGGKTNTKDFYITVLQSESLPDTATDLEALTEEIILGDNTSLDNVISNLYFPIVGASGTTSIEWTSTNEEVVSNTGVVTRGVNHKTVTINATISKEGEVTLTKEFVLTVTANYSMVNKAALQALVITAETLDPQDFTVQSYFEFEDIFYEAMDIAYNTGFTQDVVDTLKLNLERAIANLIYKSIDVSYTSGTVTKDTFVQKNQSGNPTAHNLIAKYPVAEMDQSTARKAYIGFNIENIDFNANKVYLKLYITQLGSNNSYQETVFIHSVGNNWTESGLNWSNMPANYSSAPLATHGPENIHSDNPSTAGNTRYVSFDVTDYVLQQKSQGVSEISFAVGGSNSGSSYILIDSKEKSDGNPPVLEAEKYPTIENLIIEDLQAIVLPDIITEVQTITLSAIGAVNGHTISWSSSNPDVIEPNGNVNIPDENEVVEVTATISFYGLTYEKTFPIAVKNIMSDEMDCIALTYDTIKGFNTTETDVRYDLDLIDIGENGTSISWVTSNEGVISDDGTVVRKAFADVKDVTLTATVGRFTKEFNLRVAGDYYIHDNCTTFDHVYEKSNNLTISTETTWRITGIAHSANGMTNQYVVYKAAEGTNFEVQTVVNGIGSHRVQFFTSSDNVTYTPFVSVGESAEVMPIGDFGGYSRLNYHSTDTLPEGTRYLKLAIPNTDRAWRNYVTDVKITMQGEEIAFEDIKSDNTNSKTITSDLCLPAVFADATIVWSSDSEFISNSGIFTRPSVDTNVKLTAEITRNGKVTLKEYEVVAKAYADKVSLTDRPFVWFISETNKIAGVRTDSSFGGLRNDQTTNKMFASCEIVNITAENKELIFVLAVYDESGKLIDVKYEPITVENTISSPQFVSVEMQLTPNANYSKSRIKSFVWDAVNLSPTVEMFDITRVN